MKLAGWGRFPLVEAAETTPTTFSELKAALLRGGVIARGNGRAYGDSAISKTNTITMTRFNRFLEFDEKTGLVVAQAGVLLKEVIETFLPKGWFPAITPGTKYATLGGMVAADVHGKNHHKDGSFRSCVAWIDIIGADGAITRCSRKENSALFDWSLGGMGLTGIILNVAFYLRPVASAWIKQKTMPAKNIAQAIEIFEKTLDVTYSVAWIDCLAKGDRLGRSLIMLGEHAKPQDLPNDAKKSPLHITPKAKINIPFNFPTFILNRLAIKIFNAIYAWKGSKKRRPALIDWDSYFYPLDSILNWNRIYGARGFAQFQCVIPLANAADGMRALLEATSKSGSGSFLAVLKRFGKQESPISFPMEGYTLALDFPINKRNLSLMSALDEITLKHGGRFYLAKDSRMTASTLWKSDKRIKQFNAYRKEESANLFASSQSERLGL